MAIENIITILDDRYTSIKNNVWRMCTEILKKKKIVFNK